MDLDDSNFEEVYNVLFKNKNGLEFQPLFKACKTFEEGIDLSRCLHRASQQGNVYKKNNIYLLTVEKYKEMSGGEEPPKDTDSKDLVTKEIRSFLEKNPKTAKLLDKDIPVLKPEKQPKILRIKTKQSKNEEAPVVELPFGDLQHSKALGGIALALYKVRKDDVYLSISELSEWTGCSNVVLSQRLSVLIDRKYVEKDTSLGVRRPKFKWSGNYRYPFKQWKDTDDKLVNFKTVLEWSNRKGTINGYNVPPDELGNNVTESDKESQTRNVVASISNDTRSLPDLSSGFAVWGPRIPANPAIAETYISLQMKVLKAQLEVLAHIRDNMLETT